MTETERLIDNFAALKSYGVTGTSPLEPTFPIAMPGLAEKNPVWISFVLPLGLEESSYQVTEIIPLGAQKEFVPRTALGRKLLSLRQRAIASGMQLLSEDEVLAEVRRRRGETTNDETDIY